MDNKERLIIGRFMGPHGLKGWIKVFSHTDPLENIGTYKPLLVKTDKGWQPVLFEKFQKQGKGLVAKIKGCDDREATAAYAGLDIAIEKSQLPVLEQGDFYWSDLEGLKVETLAGELLGEVDHLFDTGANDVLVVKPVANSIDSEQRLIPYILDQVVMKVDLDAGVMQVDWDADF